MSTSTKNQQAKSIRCTSCGGPLVLHGGHKIRTLNCEYCGAIMDARDDYKVLAQFSDQHRPICPLKIGMEGNIQEVNFIIVGMVGWYSHGAHWTDLMLYSPTHGYTWLSYSKGHYTFLRRHRSLPDGNIWQMEAKQTLTFNQREYQFYERFQGEITYVSGELTWIAKVGDTTHQLEAIAPPYIISGDFSEQEKEYYQGEYIPAQTIHDAFNAGKPPKQIGVHPAQPFQAPISKAIYQSARWVAGIALVALLVIYLMLSPEKVLFQHIKVNELQNNPPPSFSFTITQPNRLVELEVKTQLRNAWAYYQTIILKNNEELFSFGKDIAYYAGWEGGESWQEGDNAFTALFRVPEAGEYKIQVKLLEGGHGELNEPHKAASDITIRVRQGYISDYYILLLLALSVAGVVFYWWSRSRFEKQRWSDVIDDDWDDD